MTGVQTCALPIYTVAGATSYTWTLPNGWTGTSTTNIIIVTPDSSGTITVTANDSCGSSAPQTLYVTVTFPPPPITIIGPDTVCPNTQVLYYVSPQDSSGANFIWTKPVGWVGTSTSDSLTITSVGNSSGNITVHEQNACGSSIATLAVYVLHPPPTPGLITGNNVVSINSNQTYTIANVANATSYNWTVPANWTITSGQGTTTINVIAGSDTGQVCVSASDTCGTSG